MNTEQLIAGLVTYMEHHITTHEFDSACRSCRLMQESVAYIRQTLVARQPQPAAPQPMTEQDKLAWANFALAASQPRPDHSKPLLSRNEALAIVQHMVPANITVTAASRDPLDRMYITLKRIDVDSIKSLARKVTSNGYVKLHAPKCMCELCCLFSWIAQLGSDQW